MASPRKRRLSVGTEKSSATASKVPRIEGRRRQNVPTPPQEVRVLDFVQSHVAEISQLEQAAKARINSTTLVFQRLPRHMRRRAMSHNIKRLPVRLRQMALPEYGKRGNVGKPKVPSRKHRRRPGNLLSEYQRRQRRVRWLETHIWHAKRFQMVEQWGWRLPLHPTARGERAAYRASARHCLLQDISYNGCIEVSGPQQDIIAAMKVLFSDKTGPTVAGRGFLQGLRGGEAVLYRAGSYPRGALAHVSFLWSPIMGAVDKGLPEGAAPRQLWLWCHPASLAQVWQQLVEAAGTLTTATSAAGSGGGVGGGEGGDVQAASSTDSKNSTQGSNAQGPPTNLSSCQHIGTLCVKSLRDQLVRFRLTGPVSGEILHETLQPAGVECSRKENAGAELWWQQMYKDPKMAACHTAQRSLWEAVSSRPPGELAPHQVVALTVRDPRVLLPEKRFKVVTPKEGRRGGNSGGDCASSPETCCSPLWREDVRRQVRSSMLSVLELNKEREKLLVPGSPLLLGDRESRVPVLLIQQPGGRGGVGGEGHSPGQGAGWDLVAPGGWGMGFLLGLVLRGARPGGLRDDVAVAAEALSLHFPSDFPDTPAGQGLRRAEREEIRGRHQRRPPAKRPNYVKLGNPCPFSCPWELVARQWGATAELLHSGDAGLSDAGWLQERRKVHPNFHSKSSAAGNSKMTAEKGQGENAEGRVSITMNGADKESEEMFVLRDRKLLRLLSAVTAPQLRNLRNNQKLSSLKSRLALLAWDIDVKSLPLELAQSIVPVRVQMSRRGVPEKFAHICLPAQADLEALQADKTYAGPVELPHPDLEKAARKKVQKEKKMKKTNPRKEKIAMDTSDGKPQTEGTSSSARGNQTKEQKPEGEESKEQKSQDTKKADGSTAAATKLPMCGSNGSSPDVDLLSCCSRPILGFVNKGCFALSIGEGSGIGFCSLIGLLHLLRATPLDKPITAVVRNPKSYQYRLANITVLT